MTGMGKFYNSLLWMTWKWKVIFLVNDGPNKISFSAGGSTTRHLSCGAFSSVARKKYGFMNRFEWTV